MEKGNWTAGRGGGGKAAGSVTDWWARWISERIIPIKSSLVIADTLLWSRGVWEEDTGDTEVEASLPAVEQLDVWSH